MREDRASFAARPREALDPAAAKQRTARLFDFIGDFIGTEGTDRAVAAVLRVIDTPVRG